MPRLGCGSMCLLVSTHAIFNSILRFAHHELNPKIKHVASELTDLNEVGREIVASVT